MGHQQSFPKDIPKRLKYDSVTYIILSKQPAES